MKSDKPIKICIQRADKLGDVILSLPVVDKIAEEYPTAELHFLTSSIGENFLQYHPKVSKIHTCNVDEKWTSDAYKTLIHTLRAEEYDVFISLWNHPKMAVAARLSGAQIRVGDATGFLLKHCYTHPIRQQWEDLSRHQIGHNLDLLRPLNISSELTAGWIPIRKETQEAVQKELSKWTNSSKKTVLIFTGTGGTNEPIPEPAVADFIRLLSQREGEILKLFYGLGGIRSHSLDEIGLHFELTRERVRQIKEKALRRLKGSSKNKILRYYLG